MFYRKDAVHHQDYQRIVWRTSDEHPIKEYKLTTVTYGTASAPEGLKTNRQIIPYFSIRFQSFNYKEKTGKFIVLSYREELKIRSHLGRDTKFH